LIERFGRLSLVPAFGFGAVILAVLGAVASSATLSAICMTLLALTVLVGASGGIALAATSYPTEIRSTGVGWAMGMARFGQVCSPLIVGLMLRWGWDAARILAVMALLPFLAGAFCGAGRLYERAASAGKV
jgi:AAHS family 4-hydroxybenzoate transporter-like MFS transporter